MSDKVRVGVAGNSFWSDFMYLPDLKSHPQAELAAICGRKRAIAEKMAANAQRAREMYEKAEAAGMKHMVLFTLRWMPFFQYVHDLIDQGYIGRCYHCEFRFLMSYGRNTDYRWRFDQKRANGILGDLGVLMIDMARWLLGDITRVSAQLAVFVDKSGAVGGPIDPANDSARLLAEFANGAHGLIQASGVAHLADRLEQQQVHLYGEAGSLEINVPYWWGDTGAGIRAEAVIGGARGHEEQYQTLEVPKA